jgi:NADP-dependent 3-hydroxy acid dehydrogenase YdfG
MINVSSLGGRVAFPAGGLYSASKFALESLSDVMRMELGVFNWKRFYKIDQVAEDWKRLSRK